MTTAGLQAALKAAGHDPGAIDGKWGPRTLAALMGYGARLAVTDQMREIAAGLIGPMVGKDITTPLRICHFLAQACHETGRWLYLTELGGRTYFDRYEHRKDLGNTESGDGYLYRGRGIFQLTGRANYIGVGDAIGLNLVDHPETAAHPDVAAKVAVQYWTSHGLNALADGGDLHGITRRINGGLNGYTQREAILRRLKTVWGV